MLRVDNVNSQQVTFNNDDFSAAKPNVQIFFENIHIKHILVTLHAIFQAASMV
jgi:hypothetical protein